MDPSGSLYKLQLQSQGYSQYLEDVRGWSACTLRAYRSDLAQFLAFLIDGGEPTDVRAIEARHVHLFASWQGRRCTPRSIRRKLNCLGGFFRHLCSLGVVERSPLEGLPRPRVVENPPSVPDRTECARLLAAGATRPRPFLGTTDRGEASPGFGDPEERLAA